MASSKRRVLVTIDDAYPNVYHIERDAPPILIQINRDQYEVRKGRCLLGMVVFEDGLVEWGWRYFPHSTGKGASRVLHPDPEAALKGRFAVKHIYPLGRRDERA